MTIDLAALKTELDSDPLARGYAGMNDVAAAESLSNTLDRTVLRAASKANVIRWAARHDSITKLENGAESADVTTRRLCKAAIRLVDNPHIDSLNLPDAEIGAMVGALVTLGVFTQAEMDDLIALASVQSSRADELLGVASVTPSQVADARRL